MNRRDASSVTVLIDLRGVLQAQEKMEGKTDARARLCE